LAKGFYLSSPPRTQVSKDLWVYTKYLTLMKNFINFTLIWISQNLAIPFWMVGHIHLSLNVYDDIKEIMASLGMNLIVAIGFYLDYKSHVIKKAENQL
jgi:hypothetical protein